MALVPFKEAALGLASLVTLLELGQGLTDLKGTNSGILKGEPGPQQTSLLPNGEGRSMRFSSGNYVEVPHATSLSLGDVWTIFAWYRPRVLATTEPWNIMSKGNGAYYMRIDNAANQLMELRSQVANLANSSSSMEAEKPYFGVCTKNGITRKVYVNGVDVTTLGTNSTCANTSTPLIIGQSDVGFAGTFDGWLQYVGVCNTELSAAQVTSLWNAGSAATGAQAPIFPRVPHRGLVMR